MEREVGGMQLSQRPSLENKQVHHCCYLLGPDGSAREQRERSLACETNYCAAKMPFDATFLNANTGELTKIVSVALAYTTVTTETRYRYDNSMLEVTGVAKK